MNHNTIKGTYRIFADNIGLGQMAHACKLIIVRLQNQLLLWTISTDSKSPDRNVWIRTLVLVYAVRIQNNDCFLSYCSF